MDYEIVSNKENKSALLIASKNVNIGMRLDVYELSSYWRGLMIDIIELYIFIPVWIIFIFI